MNPLTDALKLVEDAGPAPVTPGPDEPGVPSASGGSPLDPPRPGATRWTGNGEDTGSFATSPVAEPSPECELGPIRATRHDLGPRAVAHAFGLADGAVPEPLPLSGEPRATERRSFDPRTLPRRAGTGCVAGITGSFLAIIAAAASAGYLLWSTEFVQPALVRNLSAMPVSIMDLPAVHAASAATDEAGAAAQGTALRTGSRPPTADATAATETPTASRKPTPDIPSRSGGPGEAPEYTVVAPAASDGAARAGTFALAETSAAASTTVSAVFSSPESPDSARAERPPVPVPADTSPGSGTAASPSGSPGRIAPDYHGRGGATREPARSIEPAVRTVVQAATEAFPGAFDSPAPVPESDVAEVRSDSAARIVIRKRLRDDHVTASLRAAYEALLAGDGESAARMYRGVLGHEPGNRDARLGLAAVATRDGRLDEAAGHYARILTARPADTVARAALIAIEERDATAAQSHLKALLRSEPRAAHLHFALGGLYAAQSRWPEAQRCFFDAYRFDRDNADYAYNLAVSLDHLSQSRSAIVLYREALALAQSRPPSFDAATVRRRIRDLHPSARAGSPADRRTREPAAAAPSVPVERVR